MEHFFALILAYKYAIILPIAIIEGPSITIICGALAAAGKLDLPLAYIILVLGDLIGDSAYFGLGKFIGPHLSRAKRFGVDEEKLTLAQNAFRVDGPKFLFFGKAQGLGAIVLIAAGATHYPFGKFMWYNTIATIIKSAILIAIGYMFSKQYVTAGNVITKVGIVLTFVFLAFVFFYINRRFKIWKQL